MKRLGDFKRKVEYLGLEKERNKDSLQELMQELMTRYQLVLSLSFYSIFKLSGEEVWLN